MITAATLPAVASAPAKASGSRLDRYLARERERARIANELGIPARYRHFTWANSMQTPALTVAREHIDGDAGATVVEGGVGIGKTHACAVLAMDLALAGKSVVFVPFPQLLRQLLGADRDRALKTMIEADELIIDDWGSSYTKADGLAVGLLEELVVELEAQTAPVLITTNLRPAEFKSRFGARSYDRLAGAWGRWVRIGGDSLRRTTRRTP